MSNEQRFVCEAIELARSNAEKGGRPFGAVVVRDDQVIATGLKL
jgi:guanine deaminase